MSSSETEEEFRPKSQERRSSRGKKSKEGEEARESKGNKKEQKAKEGKVKKQVKKKKASKEKGKGGADAEKEMERVRCYMEKMNRPYSIINVFDNLHGEIKKAVLEEHLEKLVKINFLTGKQYGKNKIYFLNQDSFDINQEQIDSLTLELGSSRELNSQLQTTNKGLQEEHRQLQAMKTKEELERQISSMEENIVKLRVRREKLMGNVEEKMDEATVIKEEQAGAKLVKELKKYGLIKKESLGMLCESLQKKIDEVSQIVGVDL